MCAHHSKTLERLSRKGTNKNSCQGGGNGSINFDNSFTFSKIWNGNLNTCVKVLCSQQMSNLIKLYGLFFFTEQCNDYENKLLQQESNLCKFRLFNGLQ